ncbi:PREDICTED: 28S ribosomal protein S34, mitochondrial [Ficedula albicollis]|uniref:28S ribosomal protein S34, mitochondrial n=1 Tax=Ficedula albicollis TaxID=59894 RepID=UPI0007AD7AEB|nr:PREDICTED: 28S ribosomal protein S34, mitochondrial [Ficedula albicollis]
MARKKLHRPIAAMARKIREYRALKDRPRDSQRFAVDYETMRRPLTQKRLGGGGGGGGGPPPCCAWRSSRPPRPTLNRFLFSLQNMDHGRAWGYLTFRGKTEEKVREIDKTMYHDWRMVPKHEEKAFKTFTPVPEETVQFLPYPPLLRAMILAQRQKEGKPIMEEPIIDLEKVLASPQERAKKKATGTPV